MNLKKPLDFIGQIERLKAHGMIINDEEQAIRVLKKVSYYRFSGYALQFRVDPTKSAYKLGTTFERERQYYRDSLIVKHHRNKYSSRMPLWVMVELMSFSNVSKLYSSMYISEKIVIANSVGVSYKTLENHLHCLSVLRNKCAHAARLYNTEFNPPARFNSDFLRKHPDVK